MLWQGEEVKFDAVNFCLIVLQGGWGTTGSFYTEDRFGPSPTPLFVHGITCHATEALVQVRQ